MRIVKDGEGVRLNVLGDTVIVKLGGEGYAVMENISQPNAGPPIHVHTREDESFYVLEGEHEFYMDGRRIKAGPGDFVYVPRGTKHAFRNLSSKPGKMIITVQPAGLEKFFGELDALPPGPPDMAKVLPLFEKYGLELIGPPLSAG